MVVLITDHPRRLSRREIRLRPRCGPRAGLVAIALCLGTSAAASDRKVETVVLNTATVPGLATNFRGFGPAPALNNAGDVVFGGYYSPAWGDSRTGIFSRFGGALQLVAQERVAMPEVGGLSITEFAYFDIGQASIGNAQVAFRASMSDGHYMVMAGSPGNLRKVVAGGDTLPSGRVVGQVGLPFINPGGDVTLLIAWVQGSGWVTEVDVFGAGGVITKAKPGDPAPGNVTLAGFGNPSLSTSGEVAFYAIAQRADGLGFRAAYKSEAGVLRLLLAQDDPAPGFESTSIGPRRIYAIPGVTINGPGKVALYAEATGYGDNQAIYREGSGGLDLIARSYREAPGTGGATFLSFGDTQTIDTRVDPALNDRGEVAFLGSLQGTGVTPANNQGVWAEMDGKLDLVVRSGDRLEVAPGDLRTVSSLGFYRGSSNYGVVFMANFTDNSRGVFVVRTGPSNQPPVLAAINGQSGQENQLLQFTVSATDPDPGQALVYSASNLPPGAAFDPATRTFSWTPGYDQAGVYSDVLFTVTDNGTPPLQASEAITIAVGNVNRPPVLAPIASQGVPENQLLTFPVSASDPDGDPVTISASNLPTGAWFNSADWTFNWIPAYGQAGNYTVTFTARDNGTPALQVGQPVTLTVGHVNRPPVLGAIANASVDEGQTLTFTVTATDPDGDPLTFAAANLPPGATFDPASQVFSWTPDFGQSGVWPDIEFSVTDGGQPLNVAAQLVTITVGEVNRPPVFTAIGTQQIQEGQLLAFAVQANDPDGQPLVYGASGLPSGSTFDPGTRTFRWRPDLTQAGNYTVTFQATDNGQPARVGQLAVAIVVGETPTPCEWSARITRAVTALALRKAVTDSYMANLKKVCGFVEAGQVAPACNQVTAFIGKVRTDLQHGDIPAAAGEDLIAMAGQLLAVLRPQ